MILRTGWLGVGRRTSSQKLGVEGDRGKDFGLANDWMAVVIKQVGNYGEVFDRNVGKSSPLKIERGLNALWTQGGLQYAPPVR